MADIWITKNYRREKVQLNATSPDGIKWVKENMDTEDGLKPITVDADGVEDIIKLIEAAGLTVESKV